MSDVEKHSFSEAEKASNDFVEQIALPGHVGTDAEGHAIVDFDPAEEAKLRRKVSRVVLLKRRREIN